MKIAILLALYNGERFLNEFLESLCRQTRTDFIVYAHDDGSQDSSLEIVHAFSQKLTITVLDDPESGRGACNSFLWLLTQVNADYYFFADQDDIWLPEKVEKSLNALWELEHNWGASLPCLFCCDLRIVDSSLKVLYESFWEYVRICPEKFHSFPYQAGQNIACGCTMCFNRALRTASLPVIAHPAMHDNYLTLVTVARGGRITVSREALILYRQHERNVKGMGKPASGIIATLFYKLSLLKTVWKTNMLLYRQAKEIAPISLPTYWWCRTVCVIYKQWVGSSLYKRLKRAQAG